MFLLTACKDLYKINKKNARSNERDSFLAV